MGIGRGAGKAPEMLGRQEQQSERRVVGGQGQTTWRGGVIRELRIRTKDRVAKGEGQVGSQDRGGMRRKGGEE